MEHQARAAVRRDRAGRERREPRGLPRAWRASSDPSARRLAGDQGLARQGRQPLVPDRSAGRDRRALRQDPHVRRRSRRRRELSRIAQLPARRARRGGRPALGPARPDDLLRPALSRALPRAGRGRRVVPRHPVGLHPADRRSALARADARPRHRERLLRASRPRRAASTRTAARPSAIRSSSIRGAASWPKAAPSRAWSWPRSIRPKSRRRARGFRRCSTAGASRWSSRWRSRRTCTRCGGPA